MTTQERLAAIGAPRENAFPAALKHSARVARLRRYILFATGGCAVIAAVGLAMNALRFLPTDLRFAHIGLNGSRITIESPRLIGYRSDGRPYEIRARVGTQDIATPDVFELEGLTLRLENNADSAVNLTSQKGLYDAKHDHADLSGDITIYDGKNYDLHMETAAIDFKESVMTSDKPSTLKIDGGEVTAKRAEFVQKDRRATFIGNVRSVFYGEDEKR
jgi:lipopolysaccharide export system protein LptC